MKFVVPVLPAVIAVLLNQHPAAASWWNHSVARLDVRGVRLGMSESEVAKLHPQLQLTAIGAGDVVGGKYVTFDPSLVEHRLQDGGSCSEECFYIDFTSAKLGGGVDNLYLKQTPPAGANISDLLADMEKKYGSPTDLRQSSDAPDNSSTIKASWGMSIDNSEANPQSGRVLTIELEDDDGDLEVSISLTDFSVEAADAQLRKAYLAQVAQQQTDQSSKALSY